MQQLPHQHGGKFCDLYDGRTGSHGGQRQPVRLLSQRRIHRRGNDGRKGDGVVHRPRRDQWQGLRDLSRQRGLGVRQLGGRQVRPCDERYQLLELPRRRYCHWPEDAAAHSGGRNPVQQLPHQHGGKFCDLYNGRAGSHGGQRQPLRLLPQRRIHRRGNDGRKGDGVLPQPHCNRRERLRHLSRQRGFGIRQLGGRQVHPRGHRHQLLELPQRHHRDRPEDAAAYPGDRGSVQQLPYQYGGEFRDLHDGRAGPHVGQRQPLRLLSQRRIHRRGNDGRHRYRVLPQPHCNRRERLRHLSRQRGFGVRQLGGRQVHPRGHRHQLLELPQRHHRDRPEDAAAYPGDRSSVQQLPYQYGGEFCDLHDGRAGPHLGQRQPLRLLSQRFVHRRGNDRRHRYRVLSRSRCHQRQRLCHLSRQRGFGVRQLGGWQVHPRGDRHQLLKLPQRHHRDRPEDAAAYPGDRQSSAATAIPIRRRVL